VEKLNVMKRKDAKAICVPGENLSPILVVILSAPDAGIKRKSP